MKRFRNDPGYNFWPCVSDLMLATFMLVLLLWVTAQVYSARLLTSNGAQRKTIAELRQPAPIQRPPHDTVSAEAYARVTEELEKRKRAQAASADAYATMARKLEQMEKEKAASMDAYAKIAEELQKLKKEEAASADAYAKTASKFEEVQKENALLRERPPILDLAEAKGFSFNSGTVVLSDRASENFDAAVIAPLVKLNEQYNGYVDTIEVIGYTDEEPVARETSDIDTLLPAAMEARIPLEKLRAGSNADLGLLRAVAIMQRLKKAQQEKRLPGFPIRVYSAAQVNPPFLPGSIDPKVLRRMEIRLTRQSTSLSPGTAPQLSE